MFQNACDKLIKTITPIVVAWRSENGNLSWGISAGLIVNKDGWFLTAGHVLTHIHELDQQTSNPIPENQKRRKRNREHVTDYTVIVGNTGLQFSHAFVNQDLDIGVGKLEGYKEADNAEYPQFRASEVKLGELFCRMGYPFVDNIKFTWSKESKFSFTNLFPVPLFVNEALVSRFAVLQSGGMWIETSSPGLRGQSGGPLVDVNGNVCGIQVNTYHYPLDFQGIARDQFLNVGRAVHVESVTAFLKSEKINFTSEGD